MLGGRGGGRRDGIFSHVSTRWLCWVDLRGKDGDGVGYALG